MTHEMAAGISSRLGWSLIAGCALFCGLVSFLLCARLCSRGRRLLIAAMNCLAGGMLAMIILSPTVVLNHSSRLPPRLAILLDRSASMKTLDGIKGMSRWQSCRRLMAADSFFHEQLSSRTRLSAWVFDIGLHKSSAPGQKNQAGSGGTDLAFALEKALAWPGPGGFSALLVVTDGRSSRGLPLGLRAEEILRHRVPVWVLGCGQRAKSGQKHLRIESYHLPDAIDLGQEIKLDAMLNVGGLKSGEIDIKVYLDKKAVIKTKIRAPEDSGMLPLSYCFRPRSTGMKQLTLVASSGQGKDLISSTRTGYFVVRNRNTNILFVEGRLGWGYRQTRDSLRSLKGGVVRVWNAFVLGQKEGRNLIKRLKTTDVMVLGDVQAEQLGMQNVVALARAIREDGVGLLFMGGAETAASYADTPLEPLMPAALMYAKVESGKEGLQVAALNLNDPVLKLSSDKPTLHRMISAIPKTFSMHKFSKIAQRAKKILMAEDTPVLISWQAGSGRVAMMVWPDHWLWAQNGVDGAAGHGRFFARLASWLSGREDADGSGFSISLSKYRLAPGEKATVLIVQQGAKEQNLQLRLERKGDQSPLLETQLKAIKPGVFRTEVHGALAGQYRIIVNSGKKQSSPGTDDTPKNLPLAEQHFCVQENDLELINVSPDFETLRRLAQDSGGGFYTQEQYVKIVEDLRGDLPPPVIRNRFVRRALADNWVLMLVAIASLCGAWGLARRKSSESEQN
jgi:hypothetical protein